MTCRSADSAAASRTRAGPGNRAGCDRSAFIVAPYHIGWAGICQQVQETFSEGSQDVRAGVGKVAAAEANSEEWELLKFL